MPTTETTQTLGPVLKIDYMGEQAVRRALRHPDVLGAGAAKRRKLMAAKDKIHAVMSEYKRGTLRSGGGGKKVTNRKQAVAIALSEARRAGFRIRYKKRKK